MSRSGDRAVAFQPGQGVIPAKESPVEAATRKLLADLNRGHTDHFKAVLKFWSGFYTYSYWNTVLIMTAKPDAEAAASYKKWQEQGRQVRQGAKGAVILVPVLKKEQQDDGTIKEVLKGFRFGRVFSDKDLTDIETNPLPTIWKTMPDTAQELYQDLLERIHRASGYTVREVDILYSGAKGECDHGRKRISIVRGMDSQTKCLVGIHECVHALFHGEKAKGVSTQRKEWQAQSVSYVIGSILGIEDGFSIDYLSAWRGTAEELKQSLSTIHRMCRESILAMDLRVDLGESNQAA